MNHTIETDTELETLQKIFSRDEVHARSTPGEYIVRMTNRYDVLSSGELEEALQAGYVVKYVNGSDVGPTRVAFARLSLH